MLLHFAIVVVSMEMEPKVSPRVYVRYVFLPGLCTFTSLFMPQAWKLGVGKR